MRAMFSGLTSAVAIVLASGSVLLAAEAKQIVLEIESLKLDKAKVEKMKGAGGGKVVFFDSEKCKAETTIKLPGGWYEAVLYVWAKDDDSDSTFLTIEADDYNTGVAKMPVWPWDKGKIAPCYPFQFKVEDAKKTRKIQLWADEPGVKLDRLIIKRP